MNERKAELGLVPVTLPTVRQEELSPKQQQDVVAAARMYLRDQRIVLTQDTFPIAIEVLGDASARQLQVEGRGFVGKTERIRELIRGGLEIREGIRQEAIAVIDLTRRNPTADNELSGPFAIKPALITIAQDELKGFPLRAKVVASEQVVNIARERRVILDQLAAMSLSNLPPDLSQATLDRFPSPEERSKLVRNTIASFVFRGSLSPLITTADLKEFVGGNYRSFDRFIPEIKQALIEEMGNLTEKEKAYLSDLFDQTMKAFPPFRDVPKVDDPKEIDRFYQLFSRDLLLLHPALEEQQFVTWPNKVTPGEITLWDEGFVLEGVGVATPELLAQARRQATAKGDKITEARLAEGIKLWQWLEGASKKHTERIQSAAQGLRERQELLLSIQSPSVALPIEAHSIRYKGQKDARVEATSLAQRAEGLTNIITENQKRQQEAREYEKWLKETYNAELPYRLVMPRGVFVERLREGERSASMGRSALHSLATVAEDLLARDFFLQGDAPLGVLPRPDAKVLINEILQKTETDLKELSEDEDRFPYSPPVKRKILEHIILKVERSRRYRYHPPEALGEFSKFWLGSYIRVLDIDRKAREGLGHPQTIWAEFVADALRQRVNALHYVNSLIDRKSQQDERWEDARREYSLYSQDSARSLPAAAYWSQTEALNYLKETKVADVPNLWLQDLTELGPIARQLRVMLRYDFPVSVLPKRIPTPDEFTSTVNQSRDMLAQQFREWQYKGIDETAEDAEKKAQAKRKSRRIESLEHQIRVADTILDHVDTVLVPVEEGRGLERSSFVGAWRRRIELIYANAFQEEYTSQSQQAGQSYEDLMRVLFIETLGKELEARKLNIEDLKSRNLAREFIDHMRSIGLVLDPATRQDESLSIINS